VFLFVIWRTVCSCFFPSGTSLTSVAKWMPAMYVRRYLRLTPLLAFVIGVFVWAFPLLHRTPYWGDFEGVRHDCASNLNW
jgi:hypothetical protein